MQKSFKLCLLFPILLLIFPAVGNAQYLVDYEGSGETKTGFAKDDGD